MKQDINKFIDEITDFGVDIFSETFFIRYYSLFEDKYLFDSMQKAYSELLRKLRLKFEEKIGKIRHENRKNNIYITILEEINANEKVSENELSKKYNVNIKTMRNYFKYLKDNNYITKIGNGSKTIWKINNLDEIINKINNHKN